MNTKSVSLTCFASFVECFPVFFYLWSFLSYLISSIIPCLTVLLMILHIHILILLLFILVSFRNVLHLNYEWLYLFLNLGTYKMQGWWEMIVLFLSSSALCASQGRSVSGDRSSKEAAREMAGLPSIPVLTRSWHAVQIFSGYASPSPPKPGKEPRACTWQFLILFSHDRL